MIVIRDDFSGYYADTTVLDWVSRHLLKIETIADGRIKITYTISGRDYTAVGDNLRHVVAGLLWKAANEQ